MYVKSVSFCFSFWALSFESSAFNFFSIRKSMKSAVRFVVVNHKNDTCFGNRLVMGSADYLYYAVLLQHQRSYIKVEFKGFPTLSR